MDVVKFIVNFILVFIAFGLGVTITLDQVKDVAKYKVAFVIGVASQFGFMPFIGWALSRSFSLNTAISLGVIILCSAPGGAFSNFFCHHAGGNLTLSIAMTAFSTLAALGMMPLMIYIWADEIGGFEDDGEIGNIELDYVGFILTLMLVLVPTVVGMWTRYSKCGNSQLACCNVCKPLWEWFYVASTGIAVLFIVIALVMGYINYKDDVWQNWKVVVVSLLTMPVGATFGFIASKLLGLADREAITVSFETGIQNKIIPLAIIELSFEDDGEPDKGDVLQCVLHYIVIFYVEVAIMWYIALKVINRQKNVDEVLRTVGEVDDDVL